jgi:hypothetical protein
MYCSTLAQIVALSEAEQALLNQTEWSAADHARCIEIQSTLAQLWPVRRQELALERAGGAAQILGTYGPRDRERIVAHGIAPLPK